MNACKPWILEVKAGGSWFQSQPWTMKGRQYTVLLTKSSWINRKSDWWYWTQGILDLNNKRSYVGVGGRQKIYLKGKRMRTKPMDRRSKFYWAAWEVLGLAVPSTHDVLDLKLSILYGNYLTEWARLPFGAVLMHNVSIASNYFFYRPTPSHRPLWVLRVFLSAASLLNSCELTGRKTEPLKRKYKCQFPASFGSALTFKEQGCTVQGIITHYLGAATCIS